MSDPDAPLPGAAPPPPEAPPPEAAPSPPPPAASPSGPVLASAPGWVPVAVVGGIVLFLLSFVVGRIQPEGREGAERIVSDIATVCKVLGLGALAAGYFSYLLSRVNLGDAIAAFALSAVAGVGYGLGAWILVAAVGGQAPELFFVKPGEFQGKEAALLAIAGLVVSAGLFAAAFYWTVRIAWPYFRAGVALNVLAMVHLVFLLLGLAGYLNVRFTPRWLGTGIDLTESRQYSLSDRTRALLGQVEGELGVFLVDYGNGRRGGEVPTRRVQDLLREYQAACPHMNLRTLDALRSPTEVQSAFQEAGMGDALSQLTGEDDCVVLGYRPPGEKLVARTKVVAVNQEFVDTSALGNARFKGEGILSNAMNEVVFVQRRVAFLEGHGERTTDREGRQQSLSVLADAVRNDNFAVKPLNLAKEPRVPAETDIVVVAAPSNPIPASEAEALRAYLQEGGTLVVLLEPAATVQKAGESPTGLEDLLASYGLRVARDMMVVSYFVEDTALGGRLVKPVTDVVVSREEFGSHPAVRALRESGLVVAFSGAAPVLRTERVPDGVTVDELVWAPRAPAEGYKPYGARLVPGRKMQPEPGDLVDRRIALGATGERRVGGSGKGGGRVVVFGDADFASDPRLDPRSPALVPANRTLVLNTLSWAVRRDLIAIDPKTVETEVVELRDLDKRLLFWGCVVALPLLVLGVAVGVWWSRRR